MADARKTFASVVVLGLASGALAAVAGHHPWAAVGGGFVVPGLRYPDAGGSTGEVPLAGALALVELAAWGALLVTRRRVRRAVAVVALLVAVGMIVTAVLGYPSSVDALLADLHQQQAQHPAVHHTGWVWAYLAAAVLAAVAAGAAVRLVPSWPEMGSKYDAPAATNPESGADATPLDL